MKFFLLLLCFLTPVLFGRAQSEVSNRRLSLDAAYIFSIDGDTGCDQFHEEIPFGVMTLVKYQLSNTWSVEGGINFRLRERIYVEREYGDCGAGFVPYHYTTYFLDVPIRAELHAIGRKKFNFNLVGGIQETWRFYDVDFDSSYYGPADHYSSHDAGTGIIWGFKEAYRISNRIKICAEQTHCSYFAGLLKGASEFELKLGIEYLFKVTK
jgi:hypothetical protein